MFKNSYQSGLLSIFYSCGSNPLAIWDMEVKNGHIKRLTDKEVNSIVLEIVSTNVATTFITCPKRNQALGIKLPFLVMIIKNLKRYFSFEITILDDKQMRRRFRISNFQSTTNIKPFCTSMPIGLSGGWNQIQFNLADFTRRAYGSQFIETLRVQVHANARLRRIYFSDRLYPEEDLPQDYKLYLPLEIKPKKGKLAKKEQSTTKRSVKATQDETVTPREPKPTLEPIIEPVNKVSAATVATVESPKTTGADEEDEPPIKSPTASTVVPSEPKVSQPEVNEAEAEAAADADNDLEEKASVGNVKEEPATVEE